MYKKPTEYGIKNAMECGWTKEQAERGYDIFNYDGLNLYEIEAIGDCYPDDCYNDDEWVREAEKSGYCEIIPIEELPEKFIRYDGLNLRWFGWVDTPENRENIKKYCENI